MGRLALLKQKPEKLLRRRAMQSVSKLLLTTGVVRREHEGRATSGFQTLDREYDKSLGLPCREYGRALIIPSSFRVSSGDRACSSARIRKGWSCVIMILSKGVVWPRDSHF